MSAPPPRLAACATSGRRKASRSRCNIDPDRANLAGITNLDVANSATSAMSGSTVTTLQDGDKNIPVVARLKMNERARLSDIQNLYVYSSSSNDNTKIPLVQVSDIENSMMTEPHHSHRSFPRDVDLRLPCPGDHLASEITSVALPKLQRIREDHAARLQDRNRRRVQQAAGRLPQSGPGAGDLDARRFTSRCCSSSTTRSSRSWSSPPRPTAWPAQSSVCG